MSKLDQFIKSAASLSPEKKQKAEERYKELRGRRGTEKDLWSKWHEGGRKPEDLQPLLKSFEPVINSETKKRMQGLGGSIPQSALKNELRNAAVKAFESYQPDKGTQLSTHVYTNFQRVSDFVAAGRNQLYMPRSDVEQHQKFMSAREQFVDENGREPTPQEIATMMPGVSLKRIRRFSKGFSPEVFSEMGTDFEEGAPRVDVRDAFNLMKSQLNEREKQFGELHYPPPGMPQLSVEAISKQLKMPAHRVYQIKGQVERKLEKILKKE
jgi:DNA-directed RNA polymerase specialized sigma subunit